MIRVYLKGLSKSSRILLLLLFGQAYVVLQKQRLQGKIILKFSI